MPLNRQSRGESLEANLAGFTDLLRSEGLPVGTAELIDALQALQVVDLSCRSSFKTALQTTLVKDRRHYDSFERLFERYFVPPDILERHRLEAAERRNRMQHDFDEANRSLRFKGEPLRLSPEEMQLYTLLPKEQQQGLLRFVRETEAGKKVEPSFKPLLETVVKGHLRYCRSKMERAASSEGVLVSGGGPGAGKGAPDNNLRDIDIQAIREADLSAAQDLIRKLSRKLAAELGRGRRRSSRRGPIDLRRSLRDNMRFGGIIFILRHRRKRRPKQQLLLLCDVSASMQRYSTFVLQFIYGLQAAVFNLESFCFADVLEYLSPDLKERGHLQQVLDRVVRQSKTWGGGTNLAVALEQLLDDHAALLNVRTTLLVVSDTRTVALTRSLPALQRLLERVSEIIWLNPLPPEQWPYYRSVSAVGDLVDMWPCYTIGHLEQAMTRRLFKQRRVLNNGWPQCNPV
ncbi:MAG: VWA domain-containing protein [Bacillota bacterium]